MKNIKNCLSLSRLSLSSYYIRTLVIIFILAGVSLFSFNRANAYIPEINFVLKKAALTTGRKMIKIEQEVIFKVGENAGADDTVKIDETWIIEGDRNLKLSAVAKGLYKESFYLHSIYNGKNKTILVGKNRKIVMTSTDFYQKILFTRSKDSFLTYLNELSIVPNIKLSRADGVTSFLIGEPSAETLNPQLWIGQDDFIIRRIRMPSAAEISLSDVSNITHEIGIPRSQTISWFSPEKPLVKKMVQVKIKKIDVNFDGQLSLFYPQNLELPTQINFSNKTELTDTIEDFYSRFR
jgi:hypothetical protein